MTWLIFVLAVVVGIVVGWMIGQRKGLPVLGAALGVLGLIGWIVIALIPSRLPKPVSGALDDFDPSTHAPEVAPGTMPHHPPDVGPPLRPHESGDR